MSRICIKARVTGRVQGVGFRYHTAHLGLTHLLRGYARNEADGSVTVMACGEKTQINALIAWLKQGPSSARVDSMHYQELEWQHFEGFKIL